MRNIFILYPVLSLALWTLIVLSLIPIVRFRAATRGEVRIGDFRYGESAAVPPHVSLPNRNYMNLLELPVLFYVVCLVAYLSDGVTQLTVSLAWAFVGLRVLHSAIHLAYNNVLHRLVAFAAGNMVLAVLLIHTALALSNK